MKLYNNQGSNGMCVLKKKLIKFIGATEFQSPDFVGKNKMRQLLGESRIINMYGLYS